MSYLLEFSWRTFVLILLLSITPLLIHAQRIKNPSFEGSRDGNILPFWKNCGGPLSTPDVQPGNWGVVFPPDDGNTYLGLVFRIRDNGSFESVTQNLSYPFHKDSTYTFEISLAFDPNYEDPNSRQPGILKIWGGNSLCATSENLWNSPVITHKGWQTYIVNFSPKETHSTITLQGYFASLPFYNGDILIDNIKNFQACPKSMSFLGSDTTLCGEQNYIIDPSSIDGPYLWHDVSTKSKFEATVSGRYWVQGYKNGCVVSDTINITFEGPFNIDLGPDVVSCRGEEVILTLNVPNASYKWSIQSTNSSIKVTEPGKYWVDVHRGTCVETDTVNVAFRECNFSIPNIITPNGDNLNDRLMIIDDYNESWRLEIYSRWSKLMYFHSNYDNTWDGKGLADGVYYYLLKSNTTGKVYKGSLTLLR